MCVDRPVLGQLSALQRWGLRFKLHAAPGVLSSSKSRVYPVVGLRCYL